jgi:hypothetical protein
MTSQRKIMMQIFMVMIGLLGLAQSALAQSTIEFVQADWPKQLRQNCSGPIQQKF